jgi:hypothetical protein
MGNEDGEVITKVEPDGDLLLSIKLKARPGAWAGSIESMCPFCPSGFAAASEEAAMSACRDHIMDRHSLELEAIVNTEPPSDA